MSMFPSKQHKLLILTQLRTLGVAYVEVSFSGSGDSGSIEGVYCRNAEHKDIALPDVTFEWPEYSSIFDIQANTWIRKATPKPKTLEEILQQITYDALDEQGLDWYNNDGGQGQLRIDFMQSPPGITLDVGINVTNTTDYEFDFTDDCDDEGPDQA